MSPARFFMEKIATIRSNLSSSDMVCDIDEAGLDVPKFDTALSEFKMLSSEEVHGIIKKSNPKSCELDPLPTCLLKECFGTLLPVVTRMVNTSLSTSEMPSIFKKALIRPLLKKPSLDTEILKNYRPVSNLPFMSKIIEKAVNVQFQQHMERNGLYENMQSAYRRYHSTETALLKVQNDIMMAVDGGSVAVLVLLDLSAAFDTIDHAKLLHRLESRFGIQGAALAWFRSYLSGRYQSVTVDGQSSEARQLEYGVPQGSVLGPLLFTVYTTPVGDIIRSHGLDHHFFADDSQLYLCFKPRYPLEPQNLLSLMEACVADVQQWMNVNMLKGPGQKFN